MRKGKKFLAVVLSAAMALPAATEVVKDEGVAAEAAEDVGIATEAAEDAATAVEDNNLALGEYTVTLEAEETKEYVFVPEKDGYYRFECPVDESMSVKICDMQGTELEGCTYYGNQWDYSKMHGTGANLTAGTQYLIKVSSYDDENTQEIHLSVLETENMYQQYEELTIDTSYQVQTEGKTSFSLGFTPDADGKYVFRIEKPTEETGVYCDSSVEPLETPDEDPCYENHGASVEGADVDFIKVNLEQGKHYVINVTGEKLPSIDSFFVEVLKDRTLKQVDISSNKESYGSGDLKDIAENITFKAVYDDGFSEEMPLRMGYNWVWDKMGDCFDVELDGRDFWQQQSLEPGTHTISLDGDMLAEKEINFVKLSDLQYPEMDFGENEIDAYT